MNLKARSRQVWQRWLIPEPAMLFAQAKWVLRNINFAIICCCLGIWDAAITTIDFTEQPFSLFWNLSYSFLIFLICLRVNYLRATKVSIEFAQQLAFEQSLFMLSIGVDCAYYIHWLFTQANESSLIINLMVMAAIIAGSLGFSATYLPIFLSFALPMLATAQYESILQFGHSPLINTIAASLPIYVTAILYFAIQYHRSSEELIKTRFEKELLNQELTEQIAISHAAKNEAQAAEQAQTRFMVSTSHDLRQPLQALVLFMEILNRQGMNAQQIELLAKADLSIQSLTTLMNGLLDYSRIHAGIHIQSRAMSLQPILFELSAEFGAAADDKQLFLRHKDTSLWVYADSFALQLILRNLISNAIRYTEKGGILISARRRGDQVVIEVWDTGIGIDASHLPRIYETYYQINNPERHINKGVGLGLSIVLDLSKQMQARIEVKSQPNKGSVFRCYLPLCSSQFEHKLTPPVAIESTTEKSFNLDKAKAQLKGLRVLIVDDHQSVLAALSEFLLAIGCIPVCANGLLQATHEASKQTFDLLISDYRLTGSENGILVIKTLQAHYPKLNAILFTGDVGLLHDIRDQLPNIPVLRKPLEANTLFNAITSFSQLDQIQSAS
jgi:signal transduction histidine kinase/ActR/RegA family two-component response regulator